MYIENCNASFMYPFILLIQTGQKQQSTSIKIKKPIAMLKKGKAL